MHRNGQTARKSAVRPAAGLGVEFVMFLLRLAAAIALVTGLPCRCVCSCNGQAQAMTQYCGSAHHIVRR
jgi:hypothetical protein